jgi:hypothetical protein
MNKLYLGLVAFALLAMVILMAPNVLALNRGRVLRNIAIWLAVILGLALAYQNFGPGSTHNMFGPTALTNPDEVAPSSTNGKNGGDKGFTPPGE